MVKTAEFGQPCAAVPVAGKCRICGCTEDRACLIEGRTQDPHDARACGWADEQHTLCDAESCIAAAKREIGR